MCWAGIDIIPFKLWPYQIEYIRTLDKQLREGRGATAKKCRDMGITLTTLAHFFYHWRFTRGYSALVGSLNEKEVRKLEGDTDPLFSKLDIFIKNLPDWLLPEGFIYDVHSQGCPSSTLRLAVQSSVPRWARTLASPNARLKSSLTRTPSFSATWAASASSPRTRLSGYPP
jgi:hypothetical protein